MDGLAPAWGVPLIGARPTAVKWSVMVPTYNCAHLLGAALDSVVGQDPGPDRMQIVVVDDCSADNPEKIVERYAGRVEFVRHDANVGAIANFNACIERATGELVHILHGDDTVHAGFYPALEAAFDDDQVIAATTRVDVVDERGHVAKTTRSERDGSGRWADALDVLAVSNRIFAPALVARRRAYVQVGGFRADLPHAADWEMWTRLAAHGPIWFEDQVLASYRVHAGQDTGSRMLNGDNIVERRRAIELVSAHVPAPSRARRRRQALGYSVLYALRTSAGLARSGRPRGAARQLAQAARCAAAAIR